MKVTPNSGRLPPLRVFPERRSSLRLLPWPSSRKQVSRRVSRLFCVLLMAAGWLPTTLLAGRYPATGTQTFAGTGPITSLGDGSIIASSNNGSDGYPAAAVLANRLRLTMAGTGNTNSSFKLPDLDIGKSVVSWDATLNVRMDKSGTAADGWSLNVGPIPTGNGSGEGGFVMANGLIVAFDTYNNGSNDVPSIEIFANGISVGNFPRTFSFDTTPRSLAIHWDANGLDLTYTVNTTPVVICTNLATPGYVPAPGHRFAFSARTGGSTQGTYLDDLLVFTVPETQLETGGPVIGEFAAENSTGLEDENGDSSDWIEIYNGSASPANLAGWCLTDTAATPGMWAIPSVTVPAYGYLTVFASSKNRSNPAYPLHTNFSLSKTAGYLALIKPGGSAASEFTYGPQAQDVSYGLLASGNGYAYGYLETPTPGSKNTGLQAAGPPAEDVVFLKDGVAITGGLFATNFTLTIQPPAAVGAVVRYTIDNTPPTATSSIYSAPLPVTATRTVRARVYTPACLPGPVSSRTFLQLDSTLTNYHGSGQPFSSNLPIIVMDSFGVPVDAYSDATQARPYRLTYAVAIDRNPLATGTAANRAVITGPADFQGRSGSHVRGETSADFAQKSYAWELWNNDNQDKAAAVLGQPADSDWVLHAPYTDKTLMRNYLIYDRMRALDGTSAAMGVRFVEVFYNQDGGPLTESDYRGVYVLVEKIKRGSNRVTVDKLNDLMTDASVVSGGYIFKKDKSGIDNVSFSTSANAQTFQFVEPAAPNAAQQSWLTSYMNNFETALNGAGFANPATGYAAYINPLSFVDNQWFVEIAKQIDGYRFSTYFHKDRNGKLNCSPLWDYNLSLFNANYNSGDIHTGWYRDILGSADYYYWPRLLQDPNYLILHWDRYWELRRGSFATTTMLNYIDSLASQLVNGSTTPVTNSMPSLPPLAENPAMRHYRKWPLLGSYVWPNPAGYQTRTKFWNGATLTPTAYTSADAEVDAMKSFLQQRLAWIDDQNYVGTTVYRPPVMSRSGGSVPAGTTLALTRYSGTAPSGFTYANGGTLYYTTNDTDPRDSSGAAVGLAYGSPVVLNNSATVKARLYANGSWSPLTTASFMVDAAPASAANLAISEICYKPTSPAPGSAEYLAGFTSGNNFEYVELLNVSSGNVDLTNLKFSVGITFSFAGVAQSKLTLAPGARVLVVGNEAAFSMRYGSGLAGEILGTFSGNLSNSGETLTLLAANDCIIASVTYGIAEPWPVAAQDAGYSLVLAAPTPNPVYDAAAFHASAQPGGTPGVAPGPPFSGDPAADSDHDGFPDLLEYATGSSPTRPGSANLPTAGRANLVIGGLSQPYMTFTYRRADAADGVSYFVEYSNGLGSWSSAPADVTYINTSCNNDGSSTVTCRATAPIGSAPRQFMRLRVAQP
ncbi:MAG: CotH kinase family protein [Verrucomicrobiota bacterium]